MKKVILCLSFLLSTSAFAADLGVSAIARYSNYYAGDDDAFATCLILENGNGIVMIDGLAINSILNFSATDAQMQALKAQLVTLDAKTGSTVPLLPKDNEIGAVASRKLVPHAHYPGYSKVQSGSALEIAIKAICNIEDNGE